MRARCSNARFRGRSPCSGSPAERRAAAPVSSSEFRSSTSSTDVSLLAAGCVTGCATTAPACRDQLIARSAYPYAVFMTDVGTKPLRALVEGHRDEIKAIVARHNGRFVAVFGSVVLGEEGPDSDIDFLVELEPGTRPFELLALGAELEDALGVKVDVGTPESLRPRLRSEVLAEAVPL